MKYYVKKNSLHTDIKFTDKRLNYLVDRMKNKYADELVSNESLQIGSQKYGGVIDRKAFSPEEIDDMMITFLFSFNDRFIKLGEKTHVNVPSIYSFEGEDDRHSYNKLMSYICGSKDQKSMFELNIIRTMEMEKVSTRHVQNGFEQKVNLNDLDEVRYEDINTPMDADGNKMMADDLIGGLDESYSDVDDDAIESTYEPTDEFKYILDNFRSVLTKNQVDKIETLIDAVNTGQVDINDLFHKVTGELIKEKLGRIWFPDRKNNYIQPAVDGLLNRIRSRMNAAIKLQGFSEDIKLKSDYRKLENHSLEDNRLYSEYKIFEKYAIRDLEIDEFNKAIDVTFKNSEQMIPYDEIDKIHSNEISVKDLIRKYKLTKKKVNNPHGIVKTYVIDMENGKLLFTDKELQEREDLHCRHLLDWIRAGTITFSMNDSDDGLMKPSSRKLNDITYEDYYRLVERPLMMMDDAKELEIVRKAMNRDYFNIDNLYVLKDSYYVDYKKDGYIDQKNYNRKEYIDEVKLDKKTTIDEKIAVVI